jgi:hypothetical protein
LNRWKVKNWQSYLIFILFWHVLKDQSLDGTRLRILTFPKLLQFYINISRDDSVSWETTSIESGRFSTHFTWHSSINANLFETAFRINTEIFFLSNREQARTQNIIGEYFGKVLNSCGDILCSHQCIRPRTMNDVPMLSLACWCITFACGFKRMGTRFQEEEVGQSSYNMGLEWMGFRICITIATTSSKGLMLNI